MPQSLRRSLPLLALIAAVPLGLAAPARAADLSPNDRKYLEKDAQGAAYELALARLGTEQASRPAVKSFAQEMVSDHEKYNAALQQLGKDNGIDLPKDMNMEDLTKFKAIHALSGESFDKAFLQQAQSINANDIKEAEKEKDSTKDQQVKAFIEKFSAMDRKHEAMAKQLQH